MEKVLNRLQELQDKAISQGVYALESKVLAFRYRLYLICFDRLQGCVSLSKRSLMASCAVYHFLLQLVCWWRSTLVSAKTIYLMSDVMCPVSRYHVSTLTDGSTCYRPLDRQGDGRCGILPIRWISPREVLQWRVEDESGYRQDPPQGTVSASLSNTKIVQGSVFSQTLHRVTCLIDAFLYRFYF
jgi:hypothetical protein